MKIIHPSIDRYIDFDSNHFYSLIIENPDEYYKLTHEIYSQISISDEMGEWVLSQDNTILDLPKNAICIYDYHDIDFSSKKLQTLIHHNIESIVQSNDLYYHISEIAGLITQLNESICEHMDIPIFSEYEFNLSDLVKISNYKIVTESTLVNNIHTYIDVFQKLKGISVVVFFNLFSYINISDIHILLKQLEYMGLRVLFIEPYDKYCIDNVSKIIVDEDLCVI